jgi:glutathione S-transferase
MKSDWSLRMQPIITAFENSPDRGRGLARDLRVRWALGEVDQPYDVRLMSFKALKEPAHLALQPFGQIPTLEENGIALFETGSIVLHLAQTRPGLLPKDEKTRANAITWMFAALSTLEPPLVERNMALIFERDKPWFEQRQPILEERARKVLNAFSERLGEAEWIDGEFSAGDLMLIGVLFRAKPTGILTEYPNIDAYVARGEARPAFKQAFAAQLAVFQAHAENAK